MKKRVLLLIVLLLTFVGCNIKTIEVKPVSFGYSATAKISSDVFSGEAILKVYKNESIQVEVLEPQILAGMIINSNVGGMSVKYKEIEVENFLVDSNSALSVLSETIMSEIKNTNKATKFGGEYIKKGMTSKGEYICYYRADGFPIKIVCDSIDLKVELSDLSYIN